MGRWEPGARQRLKEAALALYLERGFEQTMVADIAELAGVSARTFFRHYADKREVLFDGSSDVEELSSAAMRAAPPGASALDVVAASLEAVARMIGTERVSARKRQLVISANPELRERELIKFASLSALLVEALRERGFDPAEASLAAETGVAVYRVAFDQWVSADQDADLLDIIDRSWVQLRTLTVSSRTTRSRTRKPR